MAESTHGKVNRRHFLQAASATTAGLLITSSKTAFGDEANSALKLGLIGCGSRGPWLGDLFQKNTNTKVVAVHDYFEDRVAFAGEQLDVPANRRYTGLDGYHELIASDVEAIAVISPPYFHPEQAIAGLEAGKHVYLAKPIAVDVPGCLAIVEAAKRINGKQSLLVDFQTRNNELFRAAAKGIHDGLIGKPVCGQAYYYANRLHIKAQPGSEVARLRNWVFDKRLSGDIIVEQNIHVLDVANWYLDGHPVKATGTGGRKARTDVGDCWDHFAVDYTYPDDVIIDFSSGQFTTGYSDLCTRLYGSEGTVDSHYGGEVVLKNRKEGIPAGKTDTIYRDGAVNNMKDFCASIKSGKYLNNAQVSADSTMTSILGRMAAYNHGEMTWDDMIARNDKLDPELHLPPDGPSRKA